MKLVSEITLADKLSEITGSNNRRLIVPSAGSIDSITDILWVKPTTTDEKS